MINALLITESTYTLYTELAEDRGEAALDYGDVKDFYLLINNNPNDPGHSADWWWMAPSAFHAKWKLVTPETPTTFAVVEPK